MTHRPICKWYYWLTAILAAVGSLFELTAARAELVRFEIISREPFAEGAQFGNAGSYERIVGRMHFELDPRLKQNQQVIDLKLAPRNAAGKVECSADLFILAPNDLSRGNGALLYDVNNRGNKLAVRFFNNGGGGNDPRSASDAGDGFLFRQGFIVVWSGWDGELLPGGDRLQLQAPVAKGIDQALTGLVRCEIVPSGKTERTVVNWANHGSYRPTEAGLKNATLTHRLLPGDPRVEVPRDQWKLHVSNIESNAPHQLPKVELEFPQGLAAGEIYELIYEAQDPLVHGTCFTTVRDMISAFKHGTGANNPLRLNGEPVVHRAHGFGVSQSGRFLREFVYSGFNEDETGSKAFDGVIPHVSGSGMGSFNHRFAQPTRHATQHDHADYPPDRFPFSYGEADDPLSGRRDGILKRAFATNTAPFVMHTQSAAEYWTRAGSLTHTDPLGRADLEIPANVRIYLFGGTQHGPAGYPPSQGDGQNLANPGDYRPFLRSLLLAVDRWSRDGTPAPAGVFPTIAAGTLVDWKQSTVGFPNIPNVRFPLVIRQPSLLDFGPRWLSEGIIDQQPPKVVAPYVMRVPRCNPDGNELDCLSPPEVVVPLGTFTGWNLRSKKAGGENELLSLTGSYIPFAKTKSEREAAGDPRRSLAERYASVDDYATQLEACCRDLANRGYLLAEDVPQLVKLHRDRASAVMVTSGKTEPNTGR